MTDDIDKLLELAESSTEKVKFEDTEVEQYLSENGIKAGEGKIPTYVIYYHYYLWKTNKRKLVPRRSFLLQLNKHFEKTSGLYNEGKRYLLDPEPFDMSQTGYFKARALLRRERDGRKKEKSKQQT